jgi:coenzyme F420-dependent glucose-6-phosphate dehydrogenase
MEWPEPAEQIARMDEALQIIRRLLEGERVNFDGRHFRTHGAFLHSPPETRTPIYVSAFGPEAAEVAGRWGDGLWTLPSPEETPKVVAAYERACTSERGEIILHAGVAWARDDETALRGALPFKGAEPTEFYEDDWHDPKAMFAHANEKISDEQYKKSSIISSDPDVHVRRIREIEELGATIVVVMNISGADPIGTIRTYADEVLPRLRRSRHAA